jgi:hypothetical protein
MVEQVDADLCFEQGDFINAQQYYADLGLNAHAAFAALMQMDIKHAEFYLSKATNNPLSRWLYFLCVFLQNPNQMHHANPGVLTFRLYFEATMQYFYRFHIEEYIRIILAQRYQLEAIYPPLRLELDKAQSNSLGNFGK